MDVPVVAYDGTISYTITVQNQGVLDSRAFTVTDTYPAGLTPVILDGGIDSGSAITWTFANLSAGASTTRTFTARISDIRLRPYRNFAEISTDSAGTYSSLGETIADIDSTPDTNVANDGAYGPVNGGAAIDNVIVGPAPAISAAGIGADSPASGGQDDADIADVDVPVVYDLALVKTGPAAVAIDGTVVFAIVVANQGNVPSGPFTVTDSVPAGLSATAASNGGSLGTPAVAVVWSNLASLDPGTSVTLTVTMKVVDYTLRPYHNVAEITGDGASLYSQPAGAPTTDIDSTPGDAATSTADNILLSEAGTGPDAGFDDEDVATVTVNPAYDLALVKTVNTPTTTFDGTVVFTITVENQGNVPSGDYIVTDTLPRGVMLQSTSGGGTLTPDGTHVLWHLPSIEPAAVDVGHVAGERVRHHETTVHQLGRDHHRQRGELFAAGRPGTYRHRFNSWRRRDEHGRQHHDRRGRSRRRCGLRRRRHRPFRCPHVL